MSLARTLPLFALLACAPPPEASAPAAPAQVVGPSVLLITLDTTRADHLGPYGYKRADTPTYDAFAAQGTVFTRAYTAAPLTIPSHSTIHTGRYPPSHGVRDNGDFVLGDEQITLAERFQEAGWSTLAFTAAFPTQKRWGFGQGFDVYHDPLAGLPNQLGWQDQRRADEVVDDAVATLGQVDGPVFTWVHLFDAHWPYAPPEPYASEFKSRPYDGELAFAAAEVGRLLTWWDAHHPDSVVLITADHGEGLGDGGEQTHGFLLHDGTTHVPLMVRGGGFAAGARVDDPVGTVDIAPTLLRAAGLSLHPELQGRDLALGGSDELYSEALTGQFNLGLTPLFAYTEAKGRYTEGAWGGWYAADGDRVAVVPDEPRDPAEPKVELAALRARLDEVLAPDAALGGDELDQLAALGYLGSDTHAAAGTIDPRDVIDLIPLTWEVSELLRANQIRKAEAIVEQLDARMHDTYGVQLLRAQLLRAKGDLVAAHAAYAVAHERSPSSNVALQLANLDVTLGDWLEAEAHFQDALALQPASPDAMAGLVRAARALSDNERAVELADEFLQRYPDYAELSLVRAEAALADYRLDEALADSDRAVEEMPDSPWSLTLNAQVLWELGRSELAIERLGDALRVDPYSLQLRLQLAECLLDVGRASEAGRTLAPALRFAPDDPVVVQLAEQQRAAISAELERSHRPR